MYYLCDLCKAYERLDLDPSVFILLRLETIDVELSHIVLSRPLTFADVESWLQDVFADLLDCEV